MLVVLLVCRDVGCSRESRGIDEALLIIEHKFDFVKVFERWGEGGREV